jgi:hypothetical protein
MRAGGLAAHILFAQQTEDWVFPQRHQPFFISDLFLF